MLLAALLAVGIVLGRLQTVARNAGSVDPISKVVRFLVEPAAGGVAGAANGVSDFFAGMARGASLASENRRLREAEAAAALYQERVDFLVAEIDKQRKLLGLPTYPGVRKIPALVIQYAPLENRMTINRGTRHGIKARLPVVAGDGLVGVVQTADALSSQVLLISSPRIQVGAVVNRDPAPYGIIRGEAANKMIMEIAGIKSTVEPGDVVLTSGLGELIPGGIPIGIVSQKESDEEYGTLRCQIFPFVHVGDVREVVVLR